jgi:hypothetical protein
LPTPVLANDLNGKIAALDVGDPRATRHFYAFAASPGDLLITVNSKNLDGDVDVFTAITFRPLMKASLYSSSQSAPVTKGIYLRAHQLLILRVEARTPNDDPGTYHIRFAGTFEPFSGGIPVAENPTELSTEKSSPNRLSSVGATLPKPPPEVTETAEAKPLPSPDKSAEKTPAATESAKTQPAKPKSTTARNTPARPPRRSTRPSTSRRQPPAKKTEPSTRTESETVGTESKTESTKTETPKKEPAKAEKATEENSPLTEKSSPNASTERSKPQETAAQLPGARLIIEEKDGTRIERPMATVRRVVIEGSTIVITLKNGRTERIAMANVARMAIEPQQ